MLSAGYLKNTTKIQKVRIIILVVSIVSLACGFLSDSFNMLAISLMLFWIHNVMYLSENIKSRFLVLLLHVTVFTFLISRPFIGTLRAEEWWNAMSQAPKNIYFAIIAVLISMMTLLIGTQAGEYLNKNLKEKVKSENQEAFRRNLQAVSMIVFYITICFFLIKEGEKLLYMQGRTYVEFYTGFHSQLPSIFYTIASFMKYSLCIFLATMPSKRKAFVPLALFEISAIPELLIGVRNPIMLNSLFILIYYVVRDIYKDEKKWIGKIEKWILAITVPVTLIFMSAYTYLRSGLEVAEKNIFKLFVDFFYKQGITFNVLTLAYGHKNNLPERPWRNYTFGGMIDYIVHGRIGQMLFGTEPLAEGNNWTNGTLSNNFSHNFSYLVRKDEYLNGHGWGSSYIIETYVDFGFPGLIVFNIVLAILLIYMLKRFGRNMLWDTITFVSLTTIFFIPRAEATGWLTFIVTAQFWACVAGCYLAAYICTKSKFLQKILKRIHLLPNL